VDDLEKVRSLVQLDANKMAADDRDRTSLYFAAEGCHLEIVQYLIWQNNNNDDDGVALLHVAAENGHLEIVQFLIHQGVNREAITDYRNTPLECAVSEGHLEVVQYLVQQGTNMLRIDDNDGMTAVHFASQRITWKL
jgi:ankyrin repeat protein